jgi:hypothetical protein
MPVTIRSLTNVQVLVISILALLLPVAWIEYRVLHYTHGIIAYPLDDAFIHMTMAKNIVVNHIWGITRFGFESASSSPFYTTLLAGLFLIFGVHTAIPLLLNVLAGILILVFMQRWLTRQGVSPLSQLIILLLVNFLTPLPLLVISGMEHTFQLLFCFLFIFSFADTAEKATPAHTRLPLSLYLYGALMVTTRYECLSILGLSCLLLLIRRRWWSAISLGAVSVIPIVAFGLYAMSKGSYFMPNSVLLKSSVPNSVHGLIHFLFRDLWFKLFFSPGDYNFLAAQRLLLILPLAYLLFLPRVRERIAYRYTLIILMGATLAHVAFAYPANFPRYEDYLLGCSVLVLGTLIAKHYRELPMIRVRGGEWIAAAVLVILLIPLFIRSEKVFGKAKQYCVNIYEQQYQMAQFVHTYYDSSPVAFNDIGAISFYSHGDKLDLWGIATLEVARYKRKNTYTPAIADSLSREHRIRLAIVYDTWFDPALLHRWSKIASWHNQHNVVLGDDSVSFYATSPLDTTELRRNLERYQPSLPAAVTVSYY